MSMSAYTKPGEKVIVTGQSIQNGRTADSEKARQHLIVGQTYTIRKVQAGGSYTDVWLEEVSGVKFNSVLFENVK